MSRKHLRVFLLITSSYWLTAVICKSFSRGRLNNVQPIRKQSEQQPRTSISSTISNEEINARLIGPLKADDPGLIDYIRKNLLISPSNDPYNLEINKNNTIFVLNTRWKTSWSFIKTVVDQLFIEQKGGFFVEAGALDGEYLSNTIALEVQQNWSGLLVEPEQNNFVKLKLKNRKSWISPACLGTKPYPYEAVMTKFDITNDINDVWNRRGGSKIVENITHEFEIGYSNYQITNCYPIESLLTALNVSHIDFFSLDVEHAEISILENFPFDKVNVDVWIVENLMTLLMPKDFDLKTIKIDETYFEFKTLRENNITFTENSRLIELMENNGYYFFDVMCAYLTDYVFIRLESELFKKLQVPKDKLKRRNVCEHRKIILGDFKYQISADDLRDKTHWPQLEFLG